MASWCLTKEAEQKLLEALKKEGDPQKMVDRGTEGRQKWFAQFGEENAKNLNALFEGKMLLKSQQRGLASFVKSLGGSKQIQTDFLSKVQRVRTALSKSEVDQYLGDYTSKRLGIDAVTEEQFQAITNLSNKAISLEDVWKTKFEANPNINWEKDTSRIEWGRAQVELNNYANDLKAEARKSSLISHANPVKLASEISGNAKSIKASMDNSAIFRQGWKTLWTHPLLWQKNALNTFKTIFKTFGGKPVMDELNADLISRPNAVNGFYKKAKLAIGTIEEAFPGSVAEKIPLVGRVYKASENAFTGFVHKQRADVFDSYIKIAQKSGTELNPKQLEAIGSMVNSLTGRGNFGKFEGAGVDLVNNIFFSPRNLKSQFDTLGHVITGAGGSNFVRKQAAINLLKVVTGTAAVLAIADAVKPGSVEWDSRSADFGKIKVGNTRFEVTGGLGSLVVLASRLIKNSTKSSTTGKVSDLNTGDFGSQTKKDVIYNFFENKLSPTFSVAKEILENKTFEGDKPTITGELKNLFVPLSFSTFEELKKDPNSANIVAAMIAEGLGIGTNTYGQTVKDWTTNPTKEQSAFQEKVGSDKLKQANDDFNRTYNEWFRVTSETPTYKNLSSDSKQKAITAAKAKIQDNVFKNYGFVYKEPKKTSEQVKESATVKSLIPK